MTFGTSDIGTRPFFGNNFFGFYYGIGVMAIMVGSFTSTADCYILNHCNTIYIYVFAVLLHVRGFVT